MSRYDYNLPFSYDTMPTPSFYGSGPAYSSPSYTLPQYGLAQRPPKVTPGQAAQEIASRGAGAVAGGAAAGYGASLAGGGAAGTAAAGAAPVLTAPGGAIALAPGTGGSIWAGYGGASSAAAPSAAAPGASALPSFGGALPAAGYAAGAATGYNQLKGLSEIASNEPLTVGESAALALPTFGASLLYNPARKAFGSKKGADQVHRDKLRDGRFAPIYGDKSSGEIQLGDGQTTKTNEWEGPSYNLDQSDEATQKLAAQLDPLTEWGTGGGDAKGRSDMTGELVQAAQKSKDPLGTVRQFYERMGMDKDKLREFIIDIGNPDREGGPLIDQNRRDSYLVTLEDLWKGN